MGWAQVRCFSRQDRFAITRLPRLRFVNRMYRAPRDGGCIRRLHPHGTQNYNGPYTQLRERSMDYQDRITMNQLIRSGKPTIRGMRITVADVLGWLASGMTNDEILLDYPELTLDDIYTCLAYAADSQNRIVSLKAAA